MKKLGLLIAMGLAIGTAFPANARTQFASSGRVYRDTDQSCFGGETMGTVKNSCTRQVYWEIPLATDWDGGGGTVKVGYYASIYPISCTLAWSHVDGTFFSTGSPVQTPVDIAKHGTISLPMPYTRPIIMDKNGTAFYVSCYMPGATTLTAVGF